jgi:hypothetical protein
MGGIPCAPRTASAKAEARQCDNGASLALSRAALVSKQPAVACYGLALPHNNSLPAWRPAVGILRFLLCKNLKLKNGMEAIFEQRKG